MIIYRVVVAADAVGLDDLVVWWVARMATG